MVDLELTAPASTAAATLVGLMATESRDKFAEVASALWSRVSPEQTAAASAELAQTRVAVLGARDVGEEQSQTGIACQRPSGLLQLAGGDPAVMPELRLLMAQPQLIFRNNYLKIRRYLALPLGRQPRAMIPDGLYQAADEMKIAGTWPGSLTPPAEDDGVHLQAGV